MEHHASSQEEIRSRYSLLDEDWLRVESLLRQADPDDEKSLNFEPEGRLNRSDSDVTIVPFHQDSHPATETTEPPNTYIPSNTGDQHVDTPTNDTDADSIFIPTITIHPTRIHSVYSIPKSSNRAPSAPEENPDRKKTNIFHACDTSEEDNVSVDRCSDSFRSCETVTNRFGREETASVTTNDEPCRRRQTVTRSSRGRRDAKPQQDDDGTKMLMLMMMKIIEMLTTMMVTMLRLILVMIVMTMMMITFLLLFSDGARSGRGDGMRGFKRGWNGT